MKLTNKKNLFLILIIVFTIVLGVIAVITALKLYQLGKQPVAPSVPSSKPKAVVPACRLTFTIRVGPTNTPTPIRTPTPTPIKTPTPTRIITTTPGAPTNTPTPTPTVTTTPGGPTNTPTPIRTPTPTATPVIESCFDECSSDSNCEGNLKCLTYSGIKRCLNPVCPTEADCGCNGCWELCSNDWECISSLRCLTTANDQKRCVNSSCPAEQDCTCGEAPTSTPKPNLTPVPTTEITTPVTGPKIPILGAIMGGFALISIGLALIF